MGREVNFARYVQVVGLVAWAVSSTKWGTWAHPAQVIPSEVSTSQWTVHPVQNIPGNVATPFTVETQPETYVENAVLRCRICGSKITTQGDHISNPPDSSRRKGYTAEPLLGAKGAVHVFQNPTETTFLVAPFTKVEGSISEEKSEAHTFFDKYAWRIVYCSHCKTQIGWHFSHSDYEMCLDSNHEAPDPPTKEKDSLVEADQDERIVDDELNGKCLFLKAGWWTYHLCHKSEVRQYHMEADGSMTQDWSLGVYNTVYKSIERGGTALVRHEYIHGQKCDENGEYRHSQVVYDCCMNTKKGKQLGLMIRKIEEPAVCSYIIHVCVPTLCKENRDTSNALPKGTSVIKQGKCRSVFKDSHKEDPVDFYGIIWSALVHPDSKDMAWTKKLKVVSSLSR